MSIKVNFIFRQIDSGSFDSVIHARQSQLNQIAVFRVEEQHQRINLAAPFFFNRFCKPFPATSPAMLVVCAEEISTSPLGSVHNVDSKYRNALLAAVVNQAFAYLSVNVEVDDHLCTLQ